jgi:alkylated DNA repair protein alkB family protein 6
MMEPSDQTTSMKLPGCLDDVRIQSLPKSAYYISEFITEEEETHLLDKVRQYHNYATLYCPSLIYCKIANAPKPRWKQLTHRRLQTWPSDLTKNTLLESPLPSWLIEPVISRLHDIPLSASAPEHIFGGSPHRAPNHVLINEYLSGQGIMPHKDGPAYHPVVCTVSLGSSLCLDIYATREDGTRESMPMRRIFQEPRSLLITTDALYTDYMHGIADSTEEVDLTPTTIANWELLRSTSEFVTGQMMRETRTSLTYRDVIKTTSLSKFGMFGKR